MNVDQVMHDFAAAANTLPRDAMRWALDNWEVAGPRFVESLDCYADGVDRTDENENVLFFAIHLLGEKRDTTAFPALCRLIKDADAADRVLGDAVTENLRNVIISTYDGDASALKNLIESTTAGEFVRGAALEAMAYFTRAGLIADAEMRAYLLHLLAEMRPQSDCHVWTEWCLSVANLGYQDYASKVDQLIRRRFVPYGDMDMKDFRVQLRRTLGDPSGMAGFEFDHIQPFEDAIGALSKWAAFSEKAKVDETRHAAGMENALIDPGFDAPYINPNRQVGRNDPCPCGSGKKYKKCCLQ